MMFAVKKEVLLQRKMTAATMFRVWKMFALLNAVYQVHLIPKKIKLQRH